MKVEQNKLVSGIIAFCFIFALPLVAQSYDFSRYKVILEKDPFGTIQAARKINEKPPPVAPPSTQANWAKDYRITMLNEEKDGSLSVGLVNNRNKNSIILEIGEEDPLESLKLVSADYEKGEVKLTKNGDTQTLSISDNQPKSVPSKSPVGIKARNPTSSRSFTTSSPVKKNATISYAQRRAERAKRLAELRARQKSKAPPKPKYTGDELKQHLKEYQMEVIRKGLPPLPVEITPDMENQLIQEGVLDPQ